MAREDLLRSRTEQFCTAFKQSKSSTYILDEFFVRDAPKITEHGPLWASTQLPFLGRTFVGRREDASSKAQPTCDDYFSLLSKTLSFHPSTDAFPSPSEFVIDADAGKVCLKAHGHFEAIKTGKSWEEDIAYMLSGFDEEGRIGHWEIWADPLSAYTAVVGGRGERSLECRSDM